MATSHVANIGLINIDPLGAPVLKDDPATTLGKMLKTSTEHRVLPDAGIANTTTPTPYPTIQAYLAREATSGFSLKHMGQYIIVTEG